MGTLVPEDFPLSMLHNEAERRVVEILRDGLTDGWLLLPKVELRDERDYELDVVAVHESFGVVDIEVKGHRVLIDDGVWRDPNGLALDPPPIAQARINAYALRTRLRQEIPSLKHLNVEYGIALPNTTELTGNLPPDVGRAQILTAVDLEDPLDAIERLMLDRWGNRPLDAREVEAIVAVLRPDVQFAWDPHARARTARRRLDEISADQVRALETLDQNQRVVVTGAAGTGKTRLATAWARRAYGRGERVLLTCYNEPLAADIRSRLPEDEAVRIGAFLTLGFDLDGMPPLEPPADAGDEWWNVTAVGHLLRHWHEITERFDTIIIDEAQDFSPAWIAQLATLLDPDGPRRLLMVADEAQQIYQRGFTVPLATDGWCRCELLTNCRNTHGIARLLRRFLNGAAAPMRGPESTAVRWAPIEAGDPAAAVGAVSGELTRLLEVEQRPPSSVLVETVASALRDRLRAELGLVNWEERTDGRVVCENVHRAKGLESDTVIFVTTSDDVSDALLYIGLSRAVSELVVVAPDRLAARLNLTPAERPARP